MPNKTATPAYRKFLKRKVPEDQHSAPAFPTRHQETWAAFDGIPDSDAPELPRRDRAHCVAVNAAPASELGVLVEAVRDAQAAKSYPPLADENRAGVETDCAAYHLNRRPQTLRCWAAFETGPLRPRRINGRLMWPTAELRKLCGVAT